MSNKELAEKLESRLRTADGGYAMVPVEWVRAAASALRAMEWQTTGTAPKDGTWILGGDPCDGHRELMTWAGRVWLGESSGYWKPGQEPPFWLAMPPLPSPPTKKGEK